MELPLLLAPNYTLISLRKSAAFCPDFSGSLHHTRLLKEQHKTATTNVVVNSLQRVELYTIALRLPTTTGGLL